MIKNNETIKLFGQQFINKNDENCRIIDKNKEQKLSQYLEIDK